MTQTRIAISGAAGRMGRRIVALAAEDSALKLAVALEGSGSPHLGADAGQLAGMAANGVKVSTEATNSFDAFIDFSLPDGTMHWLKICQTAKKPIVIGTTGHNSQQLDAIREASRSIAVLKSANMSIGVNVLLRVTQMLAGLLDDNYDVEIAETHHRMKVDAPSGTALALCDVVKKGRTDAGRNTPGVTMGRGESSGKRMPGEIGISSLRIGDVVGEHTVSFGSIGETVSVSHAARSRDIFVLGALRAAKWIAGRGPGLYDMQNVLFE